MANPTATDRDDRVREQKAQLRTRHASALSKLMNERDDLKGVNALADFVSDSLRWSA